MEPTIKMLVYEQTIVYGREDARTAKLTNPRMYIPFETVLLAYLDRRVELREFDKEDALYHRTYERLSDDPKMLIKWLCAQPIADWKPYLSPPDSRIPDADLEAWEYGWTDPNNWSVDDFELIHKERVVTHDKKIVKPVGKSRPNDFASVFAVPDGEDPEGMHRIILALYNGNGERGTNYIALNEDYILIPIFRRLKSGGIIPGIEIGQLIVAIKYYLQCIAGTDPLAEQLMDLCDQFLQLDQDRLNIKIQNELL